MSLDLSQMDCGGRWPNVLPVRAVLLDSKTHSSFSHCFAIGKAMPAGAAELPDVWAGVRRGSDVVKHTLTYTLMIYSLFACIYLCMAKI